MASAVVASNTASSSSSSAPTVSITSGSVRKGTASTGGDDSMDGGIQMKQTEHHQTAHKTGSLIHKGPATFVPQTVKETSSKKSQRDEYLSHVNQRQGGSEMTSSTSNHGALPLELQQILQEVAKTGTCGWLSWSQESNPIAAVATAAFHPAVAAEPTAAQQFDAIKATETSAASTTPWEDAKASLATARRSAQQCPPRKKHRNGIHNKGAVAAASGGGASSGSKTTSSRMRLGMVDGKSSPTSRKRPLLFVGNTSGLNTTSGIPSGGAVSGPRNAVASIPSSVDTEPEESARNECDSESERTSPATHNEIRIERLCSTDNQLAASHSKSGLPSPHHKRNFPAAAPLEEEGTPYRTLQAAFRTALGLVLDNFYQTRGGYKLSPAEIRQKAILPINGENRSTRRESKQNPRNESSSSEEVFLHRRHRLLMMLSPNIDDGEDVPEQAKQSLKSDYPPFTIQRLAEVLIVPERYYTQTHKLCNCLEKLLLVTSSMEALGGITGGGASHSRMEEKELAALATEKWNQESKLQQWRLRRKTSSPTDELLVEDAGGGFGAENNQRHDPSEGKTLEQNTTTGSGNGPNRLDTNCCSPSGNCDRGDRASDSTSRENLEAAATRASLRTKFDHVGIDPHHASQERDIRAIAENRAMTNSPPPPNLAMSAAPNLALSGHSGVTGFVRHHLPDQNAELHRSLSPVLFSSGSEPSRVITASSINMLQLHHAASMAGSSVNRRNLDLMTLDTGPVSPSRRQNNNVASAAENLDLDGRSSASNSDVDSESDDISFDDSSSDRSDGSDSGFATHLEPFTAARAMALNRMQQQQRLQSRTFPSLSSLHHNDGSRPSADFEYQSGDSIDSTRAEDSGGSDSSSGDMAD